MKRYFLIFNPAGTSPPAITESKRAADYWEAKGCEVETFTRGTAAKLADALESMRDFAGSAVPGAHTANLEHYDALATSALAEYRSGQA